MGFVYFVQSPSRRLLKIGRAADLAARLSGLRSAHGGALVVLGVIEHDQSRALESWTHERFAALRGPGEWFRVESELLDFIAASTDDYQDEGWELTAEWLYVSRARDARIASDIPPYAPRLWRTEPPVMHMRGRTMRDRLRAYKEARGLPV